MKRYKTHHQEVKETLTEFICDHHEECKEKYFRLNVLFWSPSKCKNIAGGVAETYGIYLERYRILDFKVW